MGTKVQNYKLGKPVCLTDMGRNTPGVGVVKLWISLPSSVGNANTVTAFESRIGRPLEVKLLKFV